GAAQSVPRASTDLSAALTLAGSVLSRDQSLAPEIVLVTDGWDTSSSVPTDALPPGIAVSYVALPQPAEGQRPPAVVHGLTAPSLARGDMTAGPGHEARAPPDPKRAAACEPPDVIRRSDPRQHARDEPHPRPAADAAVIRSGPRARPARHRWSARVLAGWLPGHRA